MIDTPALMRLWVGFMLLTGSRMDSYPQVNGRPIWTALPEKAVVHERFCWVGIVQGFGVLEGV